MKMAAGCYHLSVFFVNSPATRRQRVSVEMLVWHHAEIIRVYCFSDHGIWKICRVAVSATDVTVCTLLHFLRLIL